MDATMTQARRYTFDAVTALTPADIDEIPWQAVTDCPGVRARELWRAGDFVHALIVYEPGARTAGLPHLAACHHIWVISGAATIGGKQVDAGSYVYVPPGVAHPIVGRGAEGCTLLQVHRPHEPHEAHEAGHAG
jgi:mannose-6-phosphate isomerase-like protein (cupin superfamily)